jgi:hypothetical protein
MIFLLASLACGEWEPCDKRFDYCGDGPEFYDSDGDGYVDLGYYGDDCDDDDATVHPGAEIVCDIREYGTSPDRDCDGVDDHVACDLDGDGLTPSDGDCDDLDAAVAVGMPEVCGDAVGKDNDCDGLVDADDSDCVVEDSAL